LLLGTVLAAGVVARLSQRDPAARSVLCSQFASDQRTVRSCATCSALVMTVRGIRPPAGRDPLGASPGRPAVERLQRQASANWKRSWRAPVAVEHAMFIRAGQWMQRHAEPNVKLECASSLWNVFCVAFTIRRSSPAFKPCSTAVCDFGLATLLTRSLPKLPLNAPAESGRKRMRRGGCTRPRFGSFPIANMPTSTAIHRRARVVCVKLARMTGRRPMQYPVVRPDCISGGALVPETVIAEARRLARRSPKTGVRRSLRTHCKLAGCARTSRSVRTTPAASAICWQLQLKHRRQSTFTASRCYRGRVWRALMSGR
jgi:hypothetical protein